MGVDATEREAAIDKRLNELGKGYPYSEHEPKHRGAPPVVKPVPGTVIPEAILAEIRELVWTRERLRR